MLHNPLSRLQKLSQPGRSQQGIRGWTPPPPSIPFKFANIFSESVKFWFSQTPNFSKENFVGSEIFVSPEILLPYPSCAPDLMEIGLHIDN